MATGNLGRQRNWIGIAAALAAALTACGGAVDGDDVDDGADAADGDDAGADADADADADGDEDGGNADADADADADGDEDGGNADADADADADGDEDGGNADADADADEDAEVDTAADAGGSPTCTITAPPEGSSAPYDADRTFVAVASDWEDGPLAGASVVWTTDRDATPLGTGLSITVLLPASGMHVVTCTATDSDGNLGTGSVTVVALSPVAEIWHPGDGEVRAAGSSIPFSGTARDREDGTLSGASLVWTSSIDGVIGTGGLFNAPLSAGTNAITLTATDGDGNTGTDTITLTITP